MTKNNYFLIKAYESGYRISENGEIFNPNKVKLNGTINAKLKYHSFGFRIENETKSIFVHRLQAYQKYKEKLFEPGILVRHKNGNHLDNSLDNIFIGTSLDNILDINPNNRILNTVNSTKIKQKYSNDLIIYIRHKYINGVKQIELFKMFNIPKSGIHHILNNLYLFERINSDNILNKKPNLEDFKYLELDEILPENINQHLNKNYLNNFYDDNFCNELKEQSKTKSYQILSEEYNISKGMIQYLVNR